MGLILSWNAASETLYGWPACDAIGHDIDQLLATQHENLSGIVHVTVCERSVGRRICPQDQSQMRSVCSTSV